MELNEEEWRQLELLNAKDLLLQELESRLGVVGRGTLVRLSAMQAQLDALTRENAWLRDKLNGE